MMVTMDQIKRGAMAYYESEIAQKANGIGQFAAYFILPALPGIIDQKVAQLRQSPIGSMLFNADGLVDLDKVKEYAESAMQHCGNIEISGFRLDATDIQKAYDAIRRG